MTGITRRIGPTLGLILSITLLEAAVANAQTTTWVTTPTDNNWSTVANWTNGVPANAATADVHYSVTTNAFVDPIVNAAQEIGDLNYDTGASQFTQSGATLTIAGISGTGITNDSSNTQIINNSITLAAAQNWNAATGNLTFGNATAVIDNGGFTLTLNGAQTTTIDGQITGAGGLTQSGTGSTILANSTNNFTGPVMISNGILQAGASGALSDVDYTITGGTLDNNGFTNTLNSATLTGSGSILTGTGGNLTITNGLAMNGTGSVSVDGGTMTVGTLSGTGTTATLVLGSGTFTDNNTADETYAGTISSNGGTFVLGNGTNTQTLMLTGDNQAGFTSGTIDITANSTLEAGTGATTALPTANYTVDGTLNANGNSFTTTGLTGAATGQVTLGAGTMTIQDTGTSTYSGSVTGAIGSAIVMDSTTSGSAQTIGGAVTNVGSISTSAENVGTLTMNGIISGATTVTANGGTMVLGNAGNTYTGATTLNAGGTVSISALGDLGNTSALTFSGGTMELTGAAVPANFGTLNVNYSTFNGGIDVQMAGQTFTLDTSPLGGGPLNVNPNNGLGTVILANPGNTYSTTNIDSGTLQVGNGTTTGSLGTGTVTISSPGNLLLDPASGATQTISNTITGTGTMEIGGTGTTVILSGTNAPATPPGVTTTIDAGNTLKGAAANIPGNVVDNGTLDFTQTTDGTYADSITSGTGNVIKNGAGTLTLSNTNTYSGTTTINAGELDVNGTTTSGTVTVEAPVTNSTTITGGTLRGTGTINADIDNFGVVSPGTSSNQEGILNAGGNFTNEPAVTNVANTGTLVINVNGPAGNPGTNNSELNLTSGSATLESGSKVQVNISGTTYQLNTDYTAIAGTAPPTNDGATISTNLIFVTAQLDLVGDDVDFQLLQSFAHGGKTFNQIQVGKYLDRNNTNTNTDFVALQNALNSITTAAQAQAALTQISGDIHPTMAQLNVNDTQIVIGQVAARLRAAPFAPGGALAVADDSSPSGDSMKLATGKTPIAFVGCDENGMPTFEGGDDCSSQWSAWGMGFGMGGSSEFDGNATGTSFGMGGVVAGMERWQDDCHLLGFYGAYVGADIDTNNGQNATMNGGQLGAYMFADDGFNYYTVLAGLEFDGDTTNRHLAIGTGTAALTDQNSSNYSDGQGFVYAERGMSFEECNYVLQPFAGVQYIYVRQNSFTETGGSNTALDLTSNGDSTNSLRSLLGARLQYAMTNHGGRRTLPELHALWLHEYLDSDTRLTATMVPIGGAPFIVQGLDSGRDWALLGGNFTWEMLNGWSMFVNYDMQTNARMTYHVGSGGLGYRW